MQLRLGVLSASAGNFGQGLAFAARAMGVPATVVVPSGAARNQGQSVARARRAKVIRLPFDEWWTVLTSRACAGEARHSSSIRSPSPAVLAGNATIGAEILEELPGAMRWRCRSAAAD